MRWRATIGAALVACALPAAAAAQGPTLPVNDIEGAVGLLYGETPQAQTTQWGEPKLAPVPRAKCDAASHPLEGEQGRVTAEDAASPQAETGWTCNLSVVSHNDTPGGFRVWRYTDDNGHVCAFYDTALPTPAYAVSLLSGPTQGVAVLDMTDPEHPVETDRLTTVPMLKPHESLNLNAKRGLLAAELGTGGTAPGLMSIYSVKDDCRHPVLQSDYFAAPFGHESGFAPDGNTFWIGGAQGIFAVDVSNPKDPYTVRAINIPSHGINLSDDGNTLYETNPIDGGIALLDVSGVQARDASKPVTEISRLSWETTSIPQNSNPVTIDGKPYLLEFDEFAFRFNPFMDADLAGAARLIDLSDPAHPKVTSNIRLEVNMPANHKEAANDPTFVPGAQTTYGAHYCNVPREVDPEIVACSFINSGLRIFDIRDPLHPREVAYYISPPQPAVGGGKSDAAFSQPAFDPARREVYYTDAASGFWNVKLTKAVWPHPLAAPSTHAKRCRIHIPIGVHKTHRGRRVLKVRVTIRGHRVKAVRKSAHRYVVTVPRALRKKPSVRIRTVVRISQGRHRAHARKYRVCR